jgi:serine protease Do
MRTIVCVLLLTVSALPVRGADPTLRSMEEQVQKSIESVSPGVVSIVVSHQDYTGHGVKAGTKPGELGGYDPTLDTKIQNVDVRRFGFGQIDRALVNKLDLSVPSNAADHLFASGVVLDAKEGLILTPYHVIEGATKIYIRGSNGAGSYANIQAADAKCDLAVLKCLGVPRGLKAVTMADVTIANDANAKPTVKRGTMVLAVGHTLASGVGEGQPSASMGIISAVRQRSAPVAKFSNVELQDKPLHVQGGLIQADVRAGLGSSGAGLFNLDGELIGLSTSLAAITGSEANGGYAIPMDRNYRRMVEVLKAGREVEYGFLGIARDRRGGWGGDAGRVLIGLMPNNSPARQGGLLENDELISIDGVKLREWDDLLITVAVAGAGNTVTVEYQRQSSNQTRTTSVTLGKNANPMTLIASVPAPTPFGLKVDYLSIKFAGVMFPNARQMDVLPNGVLLKEAEPESEAEAALKKIEAPVGFWIITQVDDTKVSQPKELYKLITGKKRVKLHLADSADPLRKVIVPIP